MDALRTYVCPGCGRPAAGEGVCPACGTDLDAIAELPTAAEYEAGGVDAVRAQYEADVPPPGPGSPALLGRRSLGFAVDGVAIMAAATAIAYVAIPADADADEFSVGMIIITVSLLMLYPAIMLAAAGGRTLGKLASGTRVEDLHGHPVGFGRAVLRESLARTFILTAITPMFGLAVDSVVALTNEERRSLHDKLAKTRVVRTR